MTLIGIILSPLGLIWGLVAQVKRWVYDFTKLRKTAALPNLVVGNLSVGGSGKTPTLIWLHHQFIQLGIPANHIGVLSRGYKRKTTGFLWATTQSNAHDIGDEPLEIATALKSANKTIAVCENRLIGMEKMHQESPDLSLVLLDDGFQHLRLQPTLSVIVCDYNNLFTRDWPMPASKLREFPWAAIHANAILVSNCPPSLSQQEAAQLKKSLLQSMKRWMVVGLNARKSIAWENHIGFLTTTTSPAVSPFDQSKTLQKEPILLITGIANPHRVVNNLSAHEVVKHYAFPDHHQFNQDSLAKIQSEFNQLQENHPNLAVVTTRKDWVKLQYLWPQNRPIFVVSSTVSPLFETQPMIQTLLTQFIHEHHID